MEKRGGLCLLGFVFLIFLIQFVFAEKIELTINPIQGDEVSFKVIIYDDNGNKIDREASYIVQDFYVDTVQEGKIDSGEEVSFKLPRDIYKRSSLWGITVNYKDRNASQRFNLGDIMRADIQIDGNNLIVENTGNVAYDRKILITIGEQDQAAQVYLEIGQTKRIKLTAPDGEYTIKVSDGTQKQDIVFSGVGLTGNVIGLESASVSGFWKQYPMVSLFLVCLIIVILVIVGLKMYHKYF